MGLKMTKSRTVIFGALLSGQVVLFVESADAIDSSDWDYSFVIGLDIGPDLAADWAYDDYNWTVVCISVWTIKSLGVEYRCLVSREGDVSIYGPGGEPRSTHQIEGAGVMREGHGNFGYVNRMRAIGDGLYVCGMSRQVYRFEPGRPEFLDGHWVDVAGATRQSPASDPPDDAGEAFERWLDDQDSVDLVDIAGSSEADIYAVGDEAWHWDGAVWQQLTLPTDEPLAAIKVVSAHEVYLVGRNGTVLRGNAGDGFVDLSSIDDNQRFIGVEVFEDVLFLASSTGLFTYDPQSRRIAPYRTSLKPELQDAHVLEAKDGVLWSIGFKDLAYFDGRTWTRVQHPDNPPIV